MPNEDEVKALPHWTDLLGERDQLTVKHATVYSDHYHAAGVPGHNQFMLIARLAEMLNRICEKTGVDVPALYYPHPTEE